MVVISVAVCSKAGKVLLARQFLPITKQRIEALLTAFPKLMTAGSRESQHTFIETENVRYVYQPLDQLYLLLITNKQSNIMEDLDTLRLFSKLIPEYCVTATENAVLKNMFSLTFAFDEVVSLGTRENVSLAQIKTNLIMDSHEEKLAKVILDNKMNEAREQSRRKAELIEKQKAEAKAKMQYEGISSSSYPGNAMSSEQYGHGHGSATATPSPYSSASYQSSTSTSSAAAKPQQKEEEKKKPAILGKGMQLGKAKKQEDFVAAVKREEAAKMPLFKQKEVEKVEQKQAAKKHVQVLVEEKIVLQLDAEATLKKMEVKGEIKLVIHDPDDSKLVLKTAGIKNNAIKSRLHPNLNQQAWTADGTLALKDASKGYPVGVGAENAPSIIKWRLASNDERDVPLTLNFWDSVDSGRSVINCEFKLNRRDLVLRDVHVVVPCRAPEPPEVGEPSIGQHAYDNKAGQLIWTIDEINAENGEGTLEFSVPQVDAAIFFPVNVMFTSEQTYANVQVLGAVHAETGAAINHEVSTSLSVEKFTLEKE